MSSKVVIFVIRHFKTNFPVTAVIDCGSLTMGELFSDMESDLMALTLWKRVLACIERILRVLGETLGLTPQHLMTTICGNDKEMSKILVMAEALEKWDEICRQSE